MAFGIICTDKGNMTFEMDCKIKNITLHQLDGLRKQVSVDATLMSIHEISEQEYETVSVR